MRKMTNGKKEEVYLCQQCAQNNEALNVEHPFSIHNFLGGLLDTGLDSQFQVKYVENIRCEQCGNTYHHFKENGRLGCDHCYEEFNEQLIPLLKKIHGNIHHVGKVPKRAGGVIRLKKQLRQLKGQLREAIETEAFESAAEIRDQIRGVEEQIQGS